MTQPRSIGGRAGSLQQKRCVGEYMLVERIGAGGMAEVYQAEYLGLKGYGSKRALKLILPRWAKHPEVAAMFCTEAKLSRVLHHPNIARVMDSGEADGELFMALEFVDGTSCARLLRILAEHGQRLPVPAAVYITVRALSGLSYAHSLRDSKGARLGIVHRDVSPGNILLSRTGEVKLTDFGIALTEHMERNTSPGEVKGKYGYMSPEQIAGSSMDARSDLFSLGIVLAEMLVGRRLFSGKNQFEVLTRMHLADISVFEERCQGLPAPLIAVVRRALERRRRDRFQPAVEFLTALLAAAERAEILVDESSLASCLFQLGVMPQTSGTHSVGFQRNSSSPPTLEDTTLPFRD